MANAESAPNELSLLPDDNNWKSVKNHLKSVEPDIIPNIFVSTEPAELIVTNGEVSLAPIAGTKLLFVKNTESDVFLYSPENMYYYLVTGRWFKAKNLKGPWLAATGKLPNDFAKIPSDHEKGSVLVSVPNTEDAKAAVLMSAVPQKQK